MQLANTNGGRGERCNGRVHLLHNREHMIIIHLRLQLR